jgi:hypothetical protein
MMKRRAVIDLVSDDDEPETVAAPAAKKPCLFVASSHLAAKLALTSTGTMIVPAVSLVPPAVVLPPPVPIAAPIALPPPALPPAPARANIPPFSCFEIAGRMPQFLFKNHAGGAPVSVSLFHCISRDVVMGKGIATHFRDEFGGKQEMREQIAAHDKRRTGVKAPLATLNEGQRYIYALLTKDKWQHKPTMDSIRRSLEAVRFHALSHNVHHLACPKIACGLDGMEWNGANGVRALLRDVFQHCAGLRLDVYLG